MVFEVNSLKVALGIGYVVKRDKYRDPNLVVLIPKDDDPLPKISHGVEWKNVEEFLLCGFSDESIAKYEKTNAIAISVESDDNIIILDLTSFKVLELNCSYEEALMYLEYVMT